MIYVLLHYTLTYKLFSVYTTNNRKITFNCNPIENGNISPPVTLLTKV
jgi:hypothetical protein